MSQYWRDRDVLVTGGTGFLGYHLVKQLCTAGARVRSFALPCRSDHPLRSLKADVIDGDILDADAVTRAAKDCDVIFHAAGSIAMWGPAIQVMHAVHHDGTRNVLRAGRNAKIVHTSSIVAIGATTRNDALNEDSPFNLSRSRIDYVHAKRNAEQLAIETAARQDVVIVNPGYLLGPEDFEPSVMGKFCRRMWKGQILLAPPGGYNLVDVRDVAAGHLLAAERGQCGRRYILGGENMPMSELINRLAKCAGMTPRWMPRAPLSMMWLAAAVGELLALKKRREPYPSFQHCRLNRFSWYVDSTRAHRELGFQSRSVDKTLNDTFAWSQSAQHRPLHGLAKWWMRTAA